MSFDFIEQSSPAYGPPTPVPIIQAEAEFEQLLHLYRERRPKRVLEVGTYAGGTFFHWLQNAQPGSVVVSVDTYEDKDNSHLYDDWTPEGVEWAIIRGDSRDSEVVGAARAFSLYDWIFIDAGHLESEVRPDWENYGPMAAPLGIVAFHDIALREEDFPRIQVARVWREIQREHTTNEYCEGGPGIGVVLMPEKPRK